MPAGSERNAGSWSDGAADVALVGVIFAQRWLGIDAVVDRGADAVVHGRVGKNLDLVVDRVDALDSLDGVFSVTLENRAGGIASEDERFALDAKGEPVEDPVVGEVCELFLYLLDDAEGIFLRPCGVGGGFLRDDGLKQKE